MLNLRTGNSYIFELEKGYSKIIKRKIPQNFKTMKMIRENFFSQELRPLIFYHPLVTKSQKILKNPDANRHRLVKVCIFLQSYT